MQFEFIVEHFMQELPVQYSLVLHVRHIFLEGSD